MPKPGLLFIFKTFMYYLTRNTSRKEVCAVSQVKSSGSVLYYEDSAGHTTGSRLPG